MIIRPSPRQPPPIMMLVIRFTLFPARLGLMLDDGVAGCWSGVVLRSSVYPNRAGVCCGRIYLYYCPCFGRAFVEDIGVRFGVGWVGHTLCTPRL